MAGALTSRAFVDDDLERVSCLVRIVYGRSLPAALSPATSLVLECCGDIVGFAALCRIPGVVVGTTDWISLDPRLTRHDRRSAAALVFDWARAEKHRLDLRTIMVYAPYPEFREIEAADLQEGETVRRLVSRPLRAD